MIQCLASIPTLRDFFLSREFQIQLDASDVIGIVHLNMSFFFLFSEAQWFCGNDNLSDASNELVEMELLKGKCTVEIEG